jgi:hypothetical protein
VEIRLKGYKYFEIERDFFNKLGVLIDTFKHKTDTYSNQNKLFSVHFQEMPGFKGKRKRGLTLILYKKPFRYILPEHLGNVRVSQFSSCFSWDD